MATAKAKERSPTKKIKSLRVRKERALRAGLLVTSKPRQHSGAKVDSDAAEEFVFTIENIVKDVSLSQSGCEGHEDGLVMIDSGASVNVCPKWFRESVLEKSDRPVQLRGADGGTLQDYGERKIWSGIGSRLGRYDFHVV